MFRSNLRWCAVLLACVSGAGLLSCTSSGDGGVSGTNDYLNRGVTVTPGTPPGNTYVTLIETAGDATTTCIGVRAVRTSNVFAAAFSVTYDPGLLRFTSSDATTSCLGTGTTVLPPQVDATTTPGRIVVGLTRNIATTTTGADCNNLDLIELCFDVVGQGQFDMNFVGNIALLKPDNTPVDFLGGNWVPAHVTVTQ